MAKLRAPVSAAVWLIVALAMIVLPSQVGATLDIFGSKTIEEIKTTKPGERNDKEWRKLGNDCTKNLDAKVRSRSEVKWLSELKSITHRDCYKGLETHVLEHLIKTKIRYPGCFEMMREYFSLCLEVCAHRKQFDILKRATKDLTPESDDQLSFTDDQTLEKYYIDTLLPKITSYTEDKKIELVLVLSTIGEIALFVVNHEPVCDENFELEEEPDSSADDNADLHLFRKLYLRLYLNKCGFEEAFKKMGENIKEISHGTLYKALYSSLKGKFGEELDLRWAFSAIEELSALGKISTNHCTDNKIRELLFDCLRDSNHDHSELRKFISKYFAIYLDKCGYVTLYQLRIEHMRQTSKKSSSLDELPTLHTYLMKVLWDLGRKEVVRRMDTLGEFYYVERISKMANCDYNNWDPLLEKVARSAEIQTFGLIMADYFSLYLEKCGFEAIYNRRIDHMRQSLGYNGELDEFPTLHSYLLVKISKYGKETVSRMMANLKELSGSEEISDRTHCNDKSDTFMVSKAFRITEFEDFSLITADFFALYLENCGLEESFKKRIDSIQRDTNSNWKSIYPTLFSLIRYHLWKKEELGVILPLIKKLSVLDSNAEEIDCSEKFRNELLQTILTYREYPSFYKLIKNYYELLLDRCGHGERLKKLVEQGDLSMTKLLDLVFLK